jgi:uncharacterized repeat protein (TIGR03803 family)
MRSNSVPLLVKHVSMVSLAFALVLLPIPEAQAQSFSVIYSFTGGADGGYPTDGFVIGSAGNLYATASVGGAYGAGVVFKLSETGAENVLYNFTGGADGANPNSRLTSDADGYLYGTTFSGGANGAGTVFKVTLAGAETVVYSFKGGTDGANPIAQLTFDGEGNLYGTTSAGGAYNGGTVFEVSKAGVETVLHSFGNGTDGTDPVAGVTLTKKGQIFGTTAAGGASGDGTVFALTPSQSGWKETILHSFALGTDGGTPYAGLVYDQSGNLYGTTTAGGQGGEDGGGTIFKLTPSGGELTFSVLDGLAGYGISGTYRNVLLDASGNIYATTHCDGTYSAGTVYELTPSGSTWNYNPLYEFTGGSDGLYSFSNLVFDKQGNLYGTTKYGGAKGYGVAFKITP